MKTYNGEGILSNRVLQGLMEGLHDVKRVGKKQLMELSVSELTKSYYDLESYVQYFKTSFDFAIEETQSGDLRKVFHALRNAAGLIQQLKTNRYFKAEEDFTLRLAMGTAETELDKLGKTLPDFRRSLNARGQLGQT